MTRDEALISAALEMAARRINSDDMRWLSRCQVADAIRAIDVDEVLARLSPATDAVARLVEAARAGLNYLENTEGEFGITLGSATGLRTALAAMEASHDPR